MTSLFLQGMIVGFAVAAPVGPIALVCIQHSITRGMLVGFAAGLGAATADAIYTLFITFGLTAVISFIQLYKPFFHLLGSLFLAYLGIITLRRAPVPAGGCPPQAAGPLRAYSSTLLLTLSNPMTLLALAAILTGVLRVEELQQTAYEKFALIAGIFSGATCWWLLLTTFFGAMRKQLGSSAIYWINKIAGILILVFGGALLVNAVAHFSKIVFFS